MLENEFTKAEGRNVAAPQIPNYVKTLYHVSWMIIAAYLLMNLVVGAIVNNFQMVLDAKKAAEDKAADGGGGGSSGDDDPNKKRHITKKPKA